MVDHARLSSYHEFIVKRELTVMDSKNTPLLAVSFVRCEANELAARGSAVFQDRIGERSILGPGGQP